MLRDFKILILKSGFDTQGDFATAADVDETRLSRIIRGRSDPREQEVKAFRRILGQEVDRIFPSAEERTGK
jgi:Helix-turn-helix